jgi:hypothetical protein
MIDHQTWWKPVTFSSERSVLWTIYTHLSFPQSHFSDVTSYLTQYKTKHNCCFVYKGKGVPRQAEMAQGVPVGYGSRFFSTFGTMKVVRSSPLRTGRLHPQEFSWYSFLEADSTPGHVVPSVASEKKIPSDTTGDRSRDPQTSNAVP